MSKESVCTLSGLWGNMCRKRNPGATLEYCPIANQCLIKSGGDENQGLIDLAERATGCVHQVEILEELRK